MSLTISTVALVGGGLALGSAMSSSGPDTSGMNAAAVSNAQLSKDQLDFAKQVYSDSAPDRAAASKRAGDVSDAELAAMKTQTGIANDTNTYNNSVFRPLESGIVQDAKNFDTEGNREVLAGKALGDVNEQFAGARASGIRDLTRRGVNPMDGSYGAVAGQLAQQQALAGADAETKSRTNSMALGRAMKMDAASLGRNLPGQQTAAAQSAISAGNSSVANATVPGQVTAGGAALMNTGYNGAVSANNSSGNLYGSIANIQNQASQANNGIYSALGTAAGAYFGSDKKAKKGIKRASPEISLAAVRKTPVSNWKYKDSSRYADGGQPHTGPMAQDVNANMGEQAAPGGKVIDLISMNGHAMNAIKALDKKVSKISLANAVPKAKQARKA